MDIRTTFEELASDLLGDIACCRRCGFVDDLSSQGALLRWVPVVLDTMDGGMEDIVCGDCLTLADLVRVDRCEVISGEFEGRWELRIRELARSRAQLLSIVGEDISVA